MKIALAIPFLTMCAAFADPAPTPVTKRDAYREMEARWREMEPRLFTDAAFAKQQIGKWIRVEGTPVSFGSPLVVRLADGATIRVFHMQKGDLEELASFRKKPAIAQVVGEITGTNAATCTVSLKAISVAFGQ